MTQEIITNPTITNLVSSLNNLNNSLTTKQQEAIIIINYAIIASIITGITIYHYIKQQEQNGIRI